MRFQHTYAALHLLPTIRVGKKGARPHDIFGLPALKISFTNRHEDANAALRRV